MSILSVKDLTVNYGAIRALKGICLDVEPGEIITLIGANGAGKTSTMNAIMGVIPKTGGSVIFNGENIARSDTVSIVKKGVILAPEGRQIFPDFTVRDNLLMGGYHSTPEENHARMKDVLEIFPVLGDRMKQLAGTLSGGEQQMLAVGRALMSRPDLVMLDEPSLGLAPLLVREIFDIILKINAEGKTVLLVEQNALAALSIAHYAYVLEVGRVVAEAPGQELLKDPKVKEAYLGG